MAVFSAMINPPSLGVSVAVTLVLLSMCVVTSTPSSQQGGGGGGGDSRRGGGGRGEGGGGGGRGSNNNNHNNNNNHRGGVGSRGGGDGGAVRKMEVEDKPPELYCSFFNNRAPEVQRNLKNCTWFKESSCCRQEEIDATFGRVKPLRGASPDCQRYTNYLMCYICSPDQYLFYLMESLTVCEEFCVAWYGACQNAILKGSIIRDLYENGKLFCESRRFKVDTVKNGKCFFFDARHDKNGAGSATHRAAGHWSGHGMVLVSCLAAAAALLGFVQRNLVDGF